MRQKLKLSSDGGDSGSKNCKRGYGGAYGGGLAESAFGGNVASVAVKMFSHLIVLLFDTIKVILR
jgi:hypothetical protein